MAKYDISCISKVQKVYNKDFINFVLEKFENKINSFTPRELLTFITYIDDIDIYKNFINTHYDKLNVGFKDMDEVNLMEYLNEIEETNQQILISSFFENIITKHNVKKIMYQISSNIIANLYNENKEMFSSITLNDWIKILSRPFSFNDKFKDILDTLEIGNIEELFDTNFYVSKWYKNPVEPLKYIETKYRNNIKPKGMLERINNKTSILSICL